MDCTSFNADFQSDFYVARPTPDQPGTHREQLLIAELAADNPWHFVSSQDAYHAARRTILHHARRAR